MENKQRLLELLQMMLLTLTGEARHRLHAVARFMRRAANNRALQLDPTEHNRYVVRSSNSPRK